MKCFLFIVVWRNNSDSKLTYVFWRKLRRKHVVKQSVELKTKAFILDQFQYESPFEAFLFVCRLFKALFSLLLFFNRCGVFGTVIKCNSLWRITGKRILAWLISSRPRPGPCHTVGPCRAVDFFQLFSLNQCRAQGSLFICFLKENPIRFLTENIKISLTKLTWSNYHRTSLAVFSCEARYITSKAVLPNSMLRKRVSSFKDLMDIRRQTARMAPIRKCV